MSTPKYPGIPITCNGNQLVATHVESRITDGGIFYPITPSTEGGELYQLAWAQGSLNVFGQQKIAIETEGEHAAQGGATTFAVTGHRAVNFTSGQGIAYAMEQYYHAPGKLSTMVLEVGARALTKHALNVHCGHDDIYSALDTGWIIAFGKDAQQTADQAIILRRVCELALNPAMNVQDGMLTTHAERVFLRPESALLREFLGHPDDIIDSPTPAQKELFGPQRRRIPKGLDLTNPALLGPVQNQEHHMNGVIARRNHFQEPLLDMLTAAYADFKKLTGRDYGLISSYRCDDASTLFISVGSAAENIEVACDYLREQGHRVGSLHLNIIRPFPEKALLEHIAGKKSLIILERTDEGLAGDNPLARDIRVALSKAKEGVIEGIEKLKEAATPRLFSGSYGIGSRDFRPEHILGAYGFSQGTLPRKDGKKASDGIHLFTLGIDHPYAVISPETPSLLPQGSIAVRFHSIGGWGMITTGKNLGEIIGEIGNTLSEKNPNYDPHTGQLIPQIHIAANPKYGSEKKGAPTNYFLVVAPERVRVNCELNHVDVVLCCDPKAFTHTNPLLGLNEGGCLVWQSEESPQTAWERIPQQYRQALIDKKIRLFILPGFSIAKEATSRPDLQLRMQGNAFLGAFFAVSTFLSDNAINKDDFLAIVGRQYEKKFGRFGKAVVDSNMQVMQEGFSRITEVSYGEINAPDLSSLRLPPLLPSLLPQEGILPTAGCGACASGIMRPDKQALRPPLKRVEKFDSEFRSGLGYHQPSSPLASVGIVAAATGATTSKYVARRQTPLYIPENCTQCMECITACPDTALPNTAQEVGTILRTAVGSYVTHPQEKAVFLSLLPELEKAIRPLMSDVAKQRTKTSFKELVTEQLDKLPHGLSTQTIEEFKAILDVVPVAFQKTTAIFSAKEKKTQDGGVFSIFVSDLCKGCGECVEQCGDHGALIMVDDNEQLNQSLTSAHLFSRLLPDTPGKYLGLYDNDAPQDSRPAALRNHLMIRRNYEALVSGDGACAGCGEKSILRAIASMTEAYMRPLYFKKAKRLLNKANRLEKTGKELLENLRTSQPASYALFKKTVAHILLGLGGEDEEDTNYRMAQNGLLNDADILDALIAVLRVDAYNHQSIQSIDGRLANGMATMMMGANTGCNTVYGSTPPANPHAYPWMNSLFQDGATISWLMGEALILQHSRRSVAPERIANLLLEMEEGKDCITQRDYFVLTHLSDYLMSEQEIAELPKVWCVGGDGALGDIGFQNLSKAILQGRPNVKFLMLDTQVYSNTGGQNSDSSFMPGGYDMNQLGAATQGKMTERKSVADILTSSHGSPYVAQVSIANAAKLYQSILEGLQYRGAAFYQCYTSCQPEHGIGDDLSAHQAKLARDSRAMPEFVFNGSLGEDLQECFDLKGNPNTNRDWQQIRSKEDKSLTYSFTTAHWAVTEARFRRHHKKITQEEAQKCIPLESLLLLITQNDINHLRCGKEDEVSYVPDFGVFIRQELGGKVSFHALSRQMVLFCVERRKAWRMFQSKAGITNSDYLAQKSLLAGLAQGRYTRQEILSHGITLLEND